MIVGGLGAQERERRKDTWSPRWYRPAKDTTVYPQEYSLEECPMWEFTGDYLKQPRSAAKAEGTALLHQTPAHSSHLWP